MTYPTQEELKSMVCELFEFGPDKWFDYDDEFKALSRRIIDWHTEQSAKQDPVKADAAVVDALIDTAMSAPVASNELLGDYGKECANVLRSQADEIEQQNALLKQASAALEVFYGSGWHYSDDEIEQIEQARDSLRSRCPNWLSPNA